MAIITRRTSQSLLSRASFQNKTNKTTQNKVSKTKQNKQNKTNNPWGSIHVFVTKEYVKYRPRLVRRAHVLVVTGANPRPSDPSAAPSPRIEVVKSVGRYPDLRRALFHCLDLLGEEWVLLLVAQLCVYN